jgi:hypothetical protein
MHPEKSLSLTVAAITLFGVSITSGCSSKPNDAQLVTNIQSQMFADAQLKSANLQVASFGGQITLKGTVPNDAARYEAYKIATETPGVTKVIDQTVVEDQNAQSALGRPSDVGVVSPQASALAIQPPANATAPSRSAPQPKSHAAQRASRNHNDRSDQDARTADNWMPAPSAAGKAPAAPMQSDPQMAPQPVAPPSPVAPATLAPAPPPPPQPKQIEIATGTTVSIRTIDSIDSSVNQAGELFHASLDAPLVVENSVVIPKGADIYVRLASAKSAGKMTGQSELRLELVKLEFQGQSYPLVSSTYSQVGESRGKDTAKKSEAARFSGRLSEQSPEAAKARQSARPLGEGRAASTKARPMASK